jgi:hypothetical protein
LPLIALGPLLHSWKQNGLNTSIRIHFQTCWWIQSHNKSMVSIGALTFFCDPTLDLVYQLIKPLSLLGLLYTPSNKSTSPNVHHYIYAYPKPICKASQWNLLVNNYFFYKFFFRIKCALFLLKIGEDFKYWLFRKQHELKLVKFMFTIHFDISNSNKPWKLWILKMCFEQNYSFLGGKNYGCIIYMI